MMQNVVVGTPLLPAWHWLSESPEDFEQNDSAVTLFTSERFLPRILVEAGLVKSASEVRRNQPKLVRNLDTPDCMEVKWGKKRLFIVVGE